MTIPTTDNHLDPRLAAQLQPPCEITAITRCPIHATHARPCPHPAVWILRAPCICGTTDTCLICNHHAELARGRDDAVVICTACGAPTPPDRIHLERI